MAYDAAQLMRHAVDATRFEMLTPKVEASRAAATGSLMGMQVEVEANPNEELWDAMEELSMMFEEKGAAKLADRRIGEKRARVMEIAKLIEVWNRTLPDMPQKTVIEAIYKWLRVQMHEEPPPTSRDLLKEFFKGSSDPSHVFAMLDVLENMVEGADAELLALIAKARGELLAERGAEIRAGINLAQEVNARASTPEEMQNLRNLYRGEVLGFTTPQECFRSILSARGAGALQQSIEFLTAGCGVDLASQLPSRPADELRRILVDLQCVQVLKTVFDTLNGLEARMLKEFGIKCLLNGEQMTGQVLDFTERSFATSTEISSFILSCGIAMLLAKMDFCRELNLIFRQLSGRLFKNEKDRERLIDASQDLLDEFVTEEIAANDEQAGEEAAK